MNILIWILGSTFLVSLISFIGVITLSLKDKLLNSILKALVALSAGALLASAFFDLLPEALEFIDIKFSFILVLIGFALFFFIEKILHWHHCHSGRKHEHTFAVMNLVGDSIHNFIDGLILGSAFIAGIELGLTTTLAIILHEIPQEISDFGVLIYSGMKKSKAIFLNFVTALIAVLGGLVAFFISTSLSSTSFLLPFAAGGFIYIAASDLIPELKKEIKLKDNLITFVVFIIGILLIYFLEMLIHV